MYLSRIQAQVNARVLKAESGQYIQEYKCPWCKHWHIGHWRRGDSSC